MNSIDKDFDVQIKDATVIISCGVEIRDLPKSVKVYPPDPSVLPDRFDASDRILLIHPSNVNPPKNIIETVRERAVLASVGDKTLYSVTQRCANNIIDNLFNLHKAYIFTSTNGDTHKGVPAYIVGAGPSLDRNIAELAKHQHNGMILAVDAACGALSKEYIQQDITVTLENKGSSHYLTHNVSNHHSLMALDITTHPSHWEVPARNRTVICNNDPAYSEPIIRHGGVPISYGGSVSLVAFAMAYYMGCDPIIIVGNDYAYTDRRCYARNTMWEEQTINRIKKEEIQGDLIEFIGCPGRGRKKAINVIDAPAWGGTGTVETSHEMLTYRDWLSQMARRCNVQVINATEGGCHIDGVPDIPLATVNKMIGNLDYANRTYISPYTPTRITKAECDEYINDIEMRAKDCLQNASQAMRRPSLETVYDMRGSFNRLPILGAYMVRWALEYQKRAEEMRPSDALQTHIAALIKGCCRVIEHIERGRK